MTAEQPIVYVVEDDASFRKSLERLIGASGLRVITFGNANGFLRLDEIEHPSCLLLDVRLPDIDGMRLPDRLAERNLRLPIVFMTGHGSIPMGVRAMKMGAVDFLPKPFEPADLLAAVERALERDARDLERASLERSAKSQFASLTQREREVLRGIIGGRLNKQIASAMGISEQTVKVHRRRVMRKTGVSSLAELVRLAEKAGIPPIE